MHTYQQKKNPKANGVCSRHGNGEVTDRVVMKLLKEEILNHLESSKLFVMVSMLLPPK